MSQLTCTACGKELAGDEVHECVDARGYIWCDKHCPACGDPHDVKTMRKNKKEQ